jgi:DNA-binding response OmpR family regulator
MEVNMALTITGETILLVEDDRTTAEMVSQMLVLQGYQVLHAANG